MAYVAVSAAFWVGLWIVGWGERWEGGIITVSPWGAAFNAAMLVPLARGSLVAWCLLLGQALVGCLFIGVFAPPGVSGGPIWLFAFISVAQIALLWRVDSRASARLAAKRPRLSDPHTARR